MSSSDVNPPVKIKNKEAAVAERFYDAANRRLVYIGNRASPQMWDELWDADEASIRRGLQPSIGSRWLLRLTSRYLKPEDGIVIEGGCGMGHYVAALQRTGYRVIGIDFAPRTVSLLNRIAPELDIRLGDLEKLELEDASVAGYWSIGVIEHFYNGYERVADEMTRVIRRNGYLFLTFPFMSPLRRAKTRTGSYPQFRHTTEPEGFYQFALDPAQVTTKFEQLGFEKCFFTAQAGLKGLKDEVSVLRPVLQKLFNYPGKSIALRGVRFLIDPVLSKLGAGHSCVLVFRRT
jgi:SAM-dependent methyltransferase